MERNGESVSRAGQERESEGVIVAKGVKKVYDSGKVKVEALRGIDLTGLFDSTGRGPRANMDRVRDHPGLDAIPVPKSLKTGPG